MASPVQSPSIRQLQLVNSPETPPSTSASSHTARLKLQRRQSSISYTSSGPSSHLQDFGATQRRNSVDHSRSVGFSPPPTHKRRPRPLSIAIPNHEPRASVPIQARPQTLTEVYAPFLSLIAHKEAQVSELRSQLTAQEQELSILKRKWEKIVRNHLAFPDRERDGLTGLDGLDKIIRGLQNAAATAADATSEASSGHPSPIFSRLSLDSSAPSTDLNHTSPDTSVDMTLSPKPVVASIVSPPTTTSLTPASTATRRRSLGPVGKLGSASSPSEPSPTPASSVSSASSSSNLKHKTTTTLRQRDNALAPLPGTALSSAAFSLIPQIKNVNLADLRGGMDKFISPQQQKRASRVFEGLWEAVASPSAVAAANVRKDKKKEKLDRDRSHVKDQDQGLVNLLDSNEDDITLMPSSSSQFTVMAPDRSPTYFEKDDLDLSITASPSGYLTAQRTLGLYAPVIKEERNEEENQSESSSDSDWNW